MKIIGLEKIPSEADRIEIKKIISSATQLYRTDEFAVVPNPSGIHPPFDIYPLAIPKRKTLDHISAILTDMDGTTTTTEALCLHSQEFMIKNITSVKSLDPETDYPHIIGNSTTKHIEYLINRYGNSINQSSLLTEFVFAALWTLIYSKDSGRISDVVSTLKLLEIEKNVALVAKKIRSDKPDNRNLHDEAEQIMKTAKISFSNTFAEKVRLAIDVYYQRYHEILLQMLDGRGEELSKSLTHGKKLIEPMPGIALFLSIVKGMLGEEVEKLHDELGAHDAKNLKKLSQFFQKHPAKIGLVTSSIFFEANIVLTEVCNVIRKQVAAWDISKLRKQQLLDAFSDYNNIYDAVVTATDSHEIRLKPHRDLYSIALYKMGIPNNEFDSALGFEDSESGSIAIRAAGVARSIGVPFDSTKGHNLKAAYEILHGGIPEAISKNLYLDIS